MDDRPASGLYDSVGGALNIPLPPSVTDLPRASYLEPDGPSTRDSTVPASLHNNTGPLLSNPLPLSLTDLPRASYLESVAPSTRDSVPASLHNNSGPLLSGYPKPESDEFLTEQQPQGDTTKARRRWPLILLGGVGFVVLVFLAVFLPVYFTVIKQHQRTSTSGSSPTSTSTPGGGGGGGGGGSNPGSTNNHGTTGGDGSTVVTEDGSTFIYNNKFGGFWVYDPQNPFNDGARPNSWTPPLNQSWTWGVDRMHGVNLGGLFVLEPFISPALYQKYPSAVDEWSLSTLMAADTASGGLNQLEDHYNTFITEQDIAEIAGAGLNWARIPVPYWAIETWPGEPFLAKTSWKYILRVFAWCRKYGIRVNLDLHTIPGSQNGYNHSGKGGQVNFLEGVMGFANAQRALEYIRVFTEFISQPQYSNVVQMFGIVNEPLASQDVLTSFYLEAHNMIRGITGIGQGKGAFMSIHDSFQSLTIWANFLPGSDRIALDSHPYFAFSGSPSSSPIDVGTGINAGGVWPTNACQAWGSTFNTSRSQFGITYAGEFSLGFNDCGLFLLGTTPVTPTYPGNCNQWEDSTNWSDATKAGLMQFALASMDASGEWFFWTWKIGNSTAGIVESPLWSYKLGLQNGWMPLDPRAADGTCAALGAGGTNFAGPYLAWQTGGAGAGAIAATASAQYPWPPTSISGGGVVSLLPSYTATAAIVSLPPPTLTPSPSKGVSVGSGWFDSGDTALAPTPIAGCTYPNAWNAADASVPALCAAAAA